MSYRIHIAALSVLAALLCLLGACAAQDDAIGSFEPDCRSRSDCAAGEICVEGYCSVEEQESVELDFRFFPPQDQSYRPQIIHGVEVSDQNRLNFGLEPAVTVASQVEENGEPGGILFSDQSGGPNGNLLFSPVGVDDSRFTTQVRVENGQFGALVNPGKYTLIFVPDSETETLPQQTWRDLRFDSNTRFVRRVPSTSGLQRVEGFLSRDIRDADVSTPVVGATVYATARDEDVISTSSVTDAEGKFSFYVERNLGLYDIHVGPSPSNPMIPQAVFEDRFEASDNGCINAEGSNISCQLPTLNLGTFVRDPVVFDLRLEDDSVDWSGTRLSVEAGLGVGVFSRSFPVEPDGSATLELYPNKYYEIDILPPTELRYSKKSVDFFLEREATVLPDSGVIQMDDEAKRRVRGTVVNSNQRPVASERIEFTPNAEAAASASQDIDTRKIVTQTDGDGRFEVFLEGVEHAVTVRPSAGSGLPISRTILTAAQIRTGENPEIQLGRPRVLTGTIIGTPMNDASSGDELAGVVVRAYQSNGGELQLVGEAQSDSSGSSRGDFRMVVSSDLQ